MLLSDRSIRSALATHPLIEPYPSNPRIQPASVDLLLGNEFEIDGWKNHTLQDGGIFLLEPGEFALAHTVETISIPRDIAARVEGKSTHGRRGLLIHATAGFIDPGFRGQVTLELANLGQSPIGVQVGEPIAQICFYQLTTPVERPYGDERLGSKYQDQTGATSARH
jgi:dCTP deaminase